jgi:hypothetical protein
MKIPQPSLKTSEVQEAKPRDFAGFQLENGTLFSNSALREKRFHPDRSTSIQ